MDNAGAPTSIDDAIWGETRYTYDANDQVAKAEFGDGFTEKFAYDPAKNVAGVALQGPGLDASESNFFSRRQRLTERWWSWGDIRPDQQTSR